MTRKQILAKFAVLFLALMGLLAPPLAFADFPPITGFPHTGAFQARLLRDKQDVAVIELSGDYSRNAADGTANVEPRTEIAKEFLRTHADSYDFLVVFSNFEFETKDALAFHIGVQNQVKGLGLPLFDNTAEFGSKGKLQGYIDMAALGRYGLNPYDGNFDLVLQTFAHEFQHQWGANLHLRKADGSAGTELLGRDDAHWSYLLNSGASVHYGSDWRDNGDGTFTAVASRQFLSPLDLYLMGMYRKDEVPPFFLIENAAVDRTQIPENGVTINGARRNLTIDDVTAADGPRVPDADHAQKEFRLGFVLLTRPGDAATDAQVTAVNAIRKAIGTRLAVLSGGRALAHTYLEPKATTGAVPTPTDAGPARAVASTADALAWLRGKQGADGRWTDHPFTAPRDTAVAFDTLNDLDNAAFSGRQRALDWLSAQDAGNTDYLARKVRALTRASASPATDVQRLLAVQNSDGGWGVAAGYLSNPLDTALVMQALRPYETSLAKGKLDGAAAFLVAHQNPDGGWGNLSDGVSRTAVSANVLQALQDRVVATVQLPRAIAFLAGRQNTDGGFGDSPSTVHDTANVVLALLSQNALGQIRSADATAYVGATQRTDGSWDGSVYATALAVRLLKSSSLFNWSVSGLSGLPASPLDGQPAVLTVKVANTGTAAAPAGVLRVYDGEPGTGAVIGADLGVPPLAVGASIDLSVLWNTLGKAGAHNLVALIDPDNLAADASKGDNRAALPFTVRAAPVPVELQINLGDVVVNPAKPTRIPSTIGISALVSNIGQTDASNVRIVLREGEGAAARIIDEKVVNLLGRSQQVINFSATVARAGALRYTLTLDPDNLQSETDKSNNSASFSVETSAALDVEVRAADIALAQTSVYLGSDASFKVVLRNSATQDTPPFRVRYSVSDGANTIEVASRTLQLASGAAAAQDVVWQSTLAGDLNFKVELDPDNVLAESDKGNNVASLPFKVVNASGANLAVSFKDLVTGTVLEGMPLSLSQVVRNTGNVAANAVEVGFYDGDPSGGKLIGALQTIPTLAPGASVTVSVTWDRYPDDAGHVVFVAVDPAAKLTEITRDDNVAFLSVGAQSLSDLALSAADMVISPQAPKPGDVINVGVKVSNLGQQSAANVVLRAYDGDPAQGGHQVGADQVLTFAGMSSQNVSFTLPASANSTTRAIVVVADPDNLIAEKRKDNNSARRDLTVQDGDLYISERFFSPNGDGVKDTTTLGFRLKAVADVTVDVIDQGGRVVRSYSGDALKNVQSGSVTWDGLNTRGSVAADGLYRLRVSGKDGVGLGEAVTTLDTNRASLIGAIDTPYEFYQNLTCELGYNATVNFQFSGDEDRLYLNVSDDGLPVFARATSSGADILKLLPAGMQAQGLWQTDIKLSTGGDKVALTRWVALNGADTKQLWVLDADGGNLKLLRQSADYSYDKGAFNADASAYVAVVGTQLHSIPLNGAAETVLLDFGTMPVDTSTIATFFSPDHRMVLLQFGYYGPKAYYLVDIANGKGYPMPAEVGTLSGAQDPVWAPNSRLFTIGAKLFDPQRGDGSQANDVSFHVFDTQFGMVKRFQTALGESDIYIGDYNLTPPSWASTSKEFVFGHGYCVRGCSQSDGARQVMRRADLDTGELETVVSTELPVDIYEGVSVTAQYVWAPNERTVLRLRPNVEYYNDSYVGIEAVALDNGNRVTTLFTAPRRAANGDVAPAWKGMSIDSFLPSGRKLLFRSDRDAADQSSSCHGSGPDLYTFSSLSNLTADLRAVRVPGQGGLVLSGTAADQNFARYSIDYALQSQPNDWKTVTPASDVQVVDQKITNWAPPSFGNFLLRMTVEDQAGNVRQQVRQVSWNDTPAITDLYKDVEFVSPNGDAAQEIVNLHYRVLSPVHLEFKVYDAANALVRTVSRDHALSGQEAQFTWDGRDNGGQVLADGVYRITVQDFEFFVTLDQTLPKVALTRNDPYGSFMIGKIPYVVYSGHVNWESSDQNYAQLLLERGAGAAPSEWTEVGRSPVLTPKGSWPVTPELSDGVQYRMTVSDKAGNKAQATVSALQRVFMDAFGEYIQSKGTDQKFLPVPYAQARQDPPVGSLAALSGITRTLPLYMQFSETVERPINRVVLQFKPSPISGDDNAPWSELQIKNFVQPNGAANGTATDGVPPQHSFGFLWDMQGLDADVNYLLRLKTIDDQGGEMLSVVDYLLPKFSRTDDSRLVLTSLQDTRPQWVRVNASSSLKEVLVQSELLISSLNDPRFAAPRSVHIAYAPGTAYSHLLGAELLASLDLRLCSDYSLTLKGTLASGDVVYSNGAALGARCIGAEWVAVPQTVEACGDTPGGKLDITLVPYANDGTKLTQMLLGQTTATGQDDILNNWNDVKTGATYRFTIDTSALAAGTKEYFVRVINEDGHQVTNPISVKISRQELLASITSPQRGQKVCGIPARKPGSLGEKVVTVRVEGSISSDSNVSYGLEYGKGDSPSTWTTFSPAAEAIDLERFSGLRSSPVHPLMTAPCAGSDCDSLPPPCNYPDAVLCGDFHPLQWTSGGIPKVSAFEGQPPTQGELGRLGLLEQIQGQVSVRMRGFDAAGHQVCTPAVSFDVDGQVDVQPALLDRTLFSAKAGAGAVRITVSPLEELTLNIDVYATEVGSDGKPKATGQALGSVVRGATISTAAGYAWNGQVDSGLAPDGSYVLRLRYTDSCGNERIEDLPVELDSTAPAVTLAAPLINASVGLNVPLSGALTDTHFQSYAIQYALASAPDQWVTLAAGTDPTPAGAAVRDLLNWNTLGLSGAVRLRLQASDAAGNQTVLDVPLTVVARTDLISYFETLPDSFSPNGDRNRDSITLRYSLLDAARVTLRIERPDGTMVKTLAADVAQNAGAVSLDWDGLNSAGQTEAEGPLVAHLSATTTNGTLLKQEVTAAFLLDVTAPKVTLFQLADFVAPKGNVTLSVGDAHLKSYQTYFVVNPSGANWDALGQGTAEADHVTIKSMEGLAEGKYGIKVVAQDTAENTTTVTRLFEIDATAPKVTLTVADTYLSAKKGPLAIQATLDEKNLAGYSLRYGQGTPGAGYTELATGRLLPLPAPLKTWDAAQVPDGAYTLWFKADDLAGQSGQATVNVVVDNTAPVAVLTTPAAGGYVRQASDITGSATDANLNDYQIEIAAGSKASASRWSVLGGGAASVSNGVLLKWQALPVDGLHTLRLTVRDKAGNSSEVLREVTVDTQAPAAPLSLNLTLTKRNEAQLSWSTSSEPDLAGYALYRNGVRVNATLLTTTSYTDAGLADGNYSYVVKAVDLAGGESPASPAANTVVSLAGPTAHLISPAKGALVSSLLDIKGTASGSDFKEYRLYLGAGASPTAWRLLRRSPVPALADLLGNWNTQGLAENAIYTLKLEAEDLSGTIATDMVTVSVDNTGPAAPTQLSASASGANVTLSWTASASPDLAGYLLMRDGRVANAQGAVVGSLKPYLIAANSYADPAVPDGAHSYYVQAMDRAENLSAASNIASVTLDNHAPHAMLTAPLAGARVGAKASVTASVADTDIATVQFQYKPAASGGWTNLGAALSAPPYAATWDNAALTLGAYQLRALATDLTGHVDPAPAAVAVTLADLQGPDAVTGLSAKVIGDTATLNWRSDAQDLGGYAIDRTGPDGVVDSRTLGASATGTLDDNGLADGAYTYRVYATDQQGNRGGASEVSVLIYAPAMVQPYTPSSATTFVLAGRVAQAGALSLTSLDDQGAAPLQLLPAADGSYASAPIAPPRGDNHYALTQTDAAGNISKPALFHVVRADAPAKPAGLKARVGGGDITLSWTANGEPDLLGYRVRVAGQDDTIDMPPAWADASSFRPGGNNGSDQTPDRVLDGATDTGWMPDPALAPAGQWLRLNYYDVATLTQVDLRWGEQGVARDYDIEGWDGEVWVPLAQVRGNAAAEVSTVLAQPYRSGAVRVKLVDTAGVAPLLAEASLRGVSYQGGSYTLSGAAGVPSFQVYAGNNLGLFSAPATLAVDSNDTTPPLPVSLTAEVDGNAVNLSWTASASDDVDYYEIRRDGAPVQTLYGADNLATSDLVPNGHYQYTVVAFDAMGNASPASNVAVVTVNASGTPALADLEVLAGGIGYWPEPPVAGQPAQLYVQLANNGAVAALRFQVLVTLTDAQGKAVTLPAQDVANLGAGETLGLALDWMPAQGGRYHVGVALDPAATVAESRRDNNQAAIDISVDGALPALPLALSAPTQGRSLLLDWSGAPLDGVAGYRVERALDSQGGYEVVADGATDTSYLDGALTDGVPYYYRVSALAADGRVLAVSAEAHATPRDLLAPAVPVLAAPANSRVPATVNVALSDITGQAEPGATVTLLRGGSVLDQAVASLETQRKTVAISGDGNPAFDVTADGRRLVVLGDRMRIVEVDSGASKLVPDTGSVDGMRWARDGRALAYVRRDPNSGMRALYVYDDGDGTTALASDAEVRSESLGWSPDGASIAFVGSDGARTGLWLTPRGGGAGRLLVAGEDYQFFAPFAWSPDGQYLAFTQAGVVKVVKAADGAPVYAHAITASSREPSWSADGTRLMYTYAGDDYRDQIAEFTLASGAVRTLNPGPVARSAARWIGANDDYVVYESGAAVLYAYDGTRKETLIGDSYSYDSSYATRGGYLVTMPYYSGTVQRIAPAGMFRFVQTHLNAGLNSFSAYAIDAAGNRGATSAVARVTLANAIGPDLAAGETDITVLPTIPVVGEPARLTAAVRNAGTSTASGVGVSVIMRDPQGALSTLHSGTVTTLAAGQSSAIALDWTPLKAGQYSFTLTLDAAGAVTELNEFNNVGVRTVKVAALALPQLAVATGATQYGANTALTGTVNLSNAGPQVSGELRLRIEDAAGYLVENLAPLRVDAFGAGQTLDVPVLWNTGAVLAGDYRVAAQLVDANGQAVASGGAAFRIAVVRQLQASLQADRGQYKAGQQAALSGVVQLVAANAGVDGASALVQVLDGAAKVVYETTQPLGNLLPGASVNVTAVWNTGANPAGQYRARMAVSAGGVLLASAETPLELVAETVAQVSGTLTLDSATVANGERVGVAYTLQNSGNVALAALPVKVTVLDPDTQAVVARVSASADLALGAITQSTASFDVANWPIKSLRAVLSVDLGGRNLVLQRAMLRVADRLPPQVTLVSPAGGGDAPLSGAETALVIKAVDRDSRVVSAEYAVGAGAWQPFAAQSLSEGLYSVHLAAVADGAQPLRVRATDAYDNVSEPVSLTLVFDNTAPAIVITGVSDGEIYTADVTPQVSVTDVNLLNSGVTLDGAAYVPGTPVHAAGAHVLRVDAEDKAGNKASRVVAFQLGQPSAPPVVTLDAPVAGALLRTPLTLAATASGGNAIASVEFQLDGGAWQAGAATAQAGLYQLTIASLADGAHQVRARASDSQGQGGSSATVAFAVDNTAPVITVTGVSDGATYTGDVTPQVVVADLNLKASVATLDGAAYVPGTVVSAAGAHSLRVDAEDKAGNQSSRVIAFQISRPAAPVASIVVPANGAFLRTPLTLTASVSSTGTTIAKAEYQVDAGSWQSFAGGQYQQVISTLADGAHQVQVRATDNLGQTGNVASAGFTVDNTAPVIAVTGVTEGGGYTAKVMPQIALTELNLKSSTITLDGVTYVSGTAVSAAGAHVLRVDAEDKAGNQASQTVNFQISQPAAPVVSLTAPLGGAFVRTPLTVTAAVSNSGTTIVKTEYLLDGAVWRVLTGGQYQQVIATLADGAHQLVVRVTDNLGQVAGSPATAFSVDNTAPAIAVTGVTDGATYTAAVTPQLVISDTNLKSSGATLDGAAYVSGTVVSQGGAHSLRVDAEDKAGNQVSKTVAFTLELPLKLSGTLKVSPAQVEVGADLALAQTVVNGGDALTGARVDLTVNATGVATPVFQYSETVNLAAGATWTMDRGWKVTGTAGTAYQAKLVVTAGSRSVTIGSAAFSAIAPVPKLSYAAAPGALQRVLVLSQCVRPSSAGLGLGGILPILVDDPVKLAKCDAARVTTLQQFLTPLGVPVKIVSNPTDFARELRAGGYTAYWVSGDGAKLTQPVLTELQAGLLLGESLMVDGLANVRDSDAALLDLTAVQARGKFATAPALTMLGGLYPAGDVSVLGEALALQAQAGATQEARFGAPDCSKVNAASSAELRNGCSATQARAGIVSGVYDRGHSLFMAYDWPTTLASPLTTATAARWAEIGRNSLGWLNTVPAERLVAGDIVTRKFSLGNQGLDASLTVTAELPAGAKALQADQSGTLQTRSAGDIATWSVKLAAGATRDLNLQFKLPSSGGGYQVRYTVKNATGGAVLHTEQLPLAVDGMADLWLDARTAVSDIDTHNLLDGVTKLEVLTWIDAAKLATTLGLNASALTDLVMAQSRLASIDGELTPAQRALAAMVRAVERRM